VKRLIGGNQLLGRILVANRKTERAILTVNSKAAGQFGPHATQFRQAFTDG
jgi:hypothetical protein